MSHSIKPGVATGDEVQKIFKYAKENNFALPAVNVVSSSTINACLETAAKVNAPIIIQFSNGGGVFNAGKGLSNENEQAAIAGSIAGARHVHLLAERYGATVILHTDHCARKLLPWIDGLLDASEEEFKRTGKPLFSSHMIDLSDEPIEQNIETCKKYLERMSKIGMTLEIELGITGGEEDGVDNTDVDVSMFCKIGSSDKSIICELNKGLPVLLNSSSLASNKPSIQGNKFLAQWSVCKITVAP